MNRTLKNVPMAAVRNICCPRAELECPRNRPHLRSSPCGRGCGPSSLHVEKLLRWHAGGTCWNSEERSLQRGVSSEASEAPSHSRWLLGRAAGCWVLQELDMRGATAAGEVTARAWHQNPKASPFPWIHLSGPPTDKAQHLAFRQRRSSKGSDPFS